MTIRCINFSRASGLQERDTPPRECDTGDDCLYDEVGTSLYSFVKSYEVPKNRKLHAQGYLTASTAGCPPAAGCPEGWCVERFCPWDGQEWFDPVVETCD